MDLWTQRVDRILMDAEDRVLLYHGIRIAPSEVAAFRTEAEHISTQLRDCYPNCNPAKQQEMATCQRAIGEVLIQLAEANHDTELDASNCGSVSSGLSGRSTPLDQYLRSSTTWRTRRPTCLLPPQLLVVVPDVPPKTSKPLEVHVPLTQAVVVTECCVSSRPNPRGRARGHWARCATGPRHP